MQIPQHIRQQACEGLLFLCLFQEATDQGYFFAFVTSFLTTGVCYLKTEEIRALNSSLDFLLEGISCPFLFASKQPRLR